MPMRYLCLNLEFFFISWQGVAVPVRAGLIDMAVQFV